MNSTEIFSAAQIDKLNGLIQTLAAWFTNFLDIFFCRSYSSLRFTNGVKLLRAQHCMSIILVNLKRSILMNSSQRMNLNRNLFGLEPRPRLSTMLSWLVLICCTIPLPRKLLLLSPLCKTDMLRMVPVLLLIVLLCGWIRSLLSVHVSDFFAKTLWKSILILTDDRFFYNFFKLV